MDWQSDLPATQLYIVVGFLATICAAVAVQKSRGGLRSKSFVGVLFGIASLSVVPVIGLICVQLSKMCGWNLAALLSHGLSLIGLFGVACGWFIWTLKRRPTLT